MRKLVIAAILLTVFARSGHSQETPPDIEVLKAQRNGAMDTVAQLAALLKAAQTAAAEREKDWAAYSAPLWRDLPNDK